MGSQCTFDKKARLRQIKQDIDGLQAKSKQSSSHVPAGMTYAEVFSAAINAAMRHKRAMVGNLSRKSDDSPAEMTFEEIQAYERVTDDYVRPSAISLPPQPGLAKSTSARFQAPLNRESGLGAGREGAEGRSHMRRQGSFAPSVFMSDAYPSSASGRGTPSAALGRLARQSSTNLSGRASATVPELHQSFRRSSTNISSRGSHGPDAAPDRASSTHKPKPQEGDAPTSKQRGGSAGGFVKPTLSPAVINYGFQAVEQQQPQQESVHKERDGGLCSTSTAGGPASPLHAQHSRLLLSQEGPRDGSPRASPGGGWGRQCGLGTMAWTSECMSPGSKRRADLALLELWSLDIADKEYGIFSRPYTAPSTLRGGKRYSSRSNSPSRGHDAASPPQRLSPPRGNPGLRPSSVPVPQSMTHGSQPQPPGSSDAAAANSRGESPVAHRSSQQGPQPWADSSSLSANASRAPSAAEAAAVGLRAVSGNAGDPRTWPFAGHAAHGQGLGGVDVILEEAEEGEEGEEVGEGEGSGEYEDLVQERQKPGFYHVMRRAPHHITTATTPYLMGLPLEVLASMEEVPCLASVVAKQIWHPPRQALNPAEHQQLCEQVEIAVAARKQRLARAKASAAAAPTDAWQPGPEPLATSWMPDSGGSVGGEAQSREPLSPEGPVRGHGSPSLPASPSKGTSKATDKVSKSQRAGEKDRNNKRGRGLIKRRPSQELESQLGWDTIMRGPQRAPRTDAAGGKVDGDGTMEEDKQATRREEEAIDKGNMKLLTPAPGLKRGPMGSWVSQAQGGVPKKKGPPAKASTWERAQFYAQQQQQKQDQEQAALMEQQVMDKPVYTPGLLTQQQQAQRQRQMAQQHYILRQQEQEREGMRLAQQEQQQQQQQKHMQCPRAELQQQQQQQGVDAVQLQRETSSKSLQDRQERLQAARDRKQTRDDKLRQGILLHSSKTPPNLPLLNKQLQQLSPPRSPTVSQIEVLDSLRPPRKAQPAPRD